MTELCNVARQYVLKVHVVGARSANAVVAEGCSPVELTWKAGVEVLCLGATKNGAVDAEPIVLFDRSVTADMRYLQKRSEHFMVKASLVVLQLQAYLTDDLWLRNARHANVQGQKLAAVLPRFEGASVLHAIRVNQIVVSMPDTLRAYLLAAGVTFTIDWSSTPASHRRFSASFRRATMKFVRWRPWLPNGTPAAGHPTRHTPPSRLDNHRPQLITPHQLT